MSVLFALAKYECQYFVHQWLVVKDIVKLDVSTACSSKLRSSRFSNHLICRSWKYHDCELSKINFKCFEWLSKRGIKYNFQNLSFIDRLTLMEFRLLKLEKRVEIYFPSSHHFGSDHSDVCSPSKPRGDNSIHNSISKRNHKKGAKSFSFLESDFPPLLDVQSNKSSSTNQVVQVIQKEFNYSKRRVRRKDFHTIRVSFLRR